MFYFSSDDVPKSLSSGLNCTSASSHLSRFFTRTVLTVLPPRLNYQRHSTIGMFGEVNLSPLEHSSPVMWRDRSQKIFPNFKSLKLYFSSIQKRKKKKKKEKKSVPGASQVTSWHLFSNSQDLLTWNKRAAGVRISHPRVKTRWAERRDLSPVIQSFLPEVKSCSSHHILTCISVKHQFHL